MHRYPFKFFKTTHLDAGHRKKAHSVCGIIHLFNKYVLSNYYVSRVMTEAGDTGIKNTEGFIAWTKISVHDRI